MKKAIIIFSLGLTLIIGGSLITFAEMQNWNTNLTTFEEEGYQTASIFKQIDISEYLEYSISDHSNLRSNQQYNFHSEKATKFIIDKNQPENSLNYEIVYYPQFGECEIRFDEYIVENNQPYYKNNHRHHLHQQQYYRYTDEFDKNDKVFLDLNSNCYQQNYIQKTLGDRLVNYEDLKTIMKLKKFPFNIQQVIITVNPKDEYKLIK